MELTKGSYSSPRWSWEILDCSMPMTFDTYDNCAFQCVYCFSYFQRAVGEGKEDYLHHKVRSVNVEAVKRIFRGEVPKSQFNTYIKNKWVMQWGGLSDGFDYYERKFRKSLELLRFFREIDYPISISTKGAWWIDDPEYVEAFRDAKNVHLKTSIITLDESKAKAIERGVASPMERFRMVEFAAKNGIAATTLRFRPFILGASADYPFTENSRRQIDEMIRIAKEHGVYSVTAEMLCWESRASTTAKDRIAIIGQITGMGDLFAFYRAHSQSKNGLMRLNYDLKRPYFEALMESAEKHGMPAFISDAHHKEKSAHAGCCGLPDTGPLSKNNRGQFAHAIQIAKKNGKVHWSDIAKEAEWLKDIDFVGATGFNEGGTEERVKRAYQSMFDYMRQAWNDPRSGLSPNRYFGGALVASEPDANGDIVYLYNKPYIEEGKRVSSVRELQLHLVQQGLAMMDDGAQWGHVAYPVAVNAADANSEVTRNLVKQLEIARLNYQLFVENRDFGEFQLAFPSADIVALNTENHREEIIGVFGLQGTERIWLLDARCVMTSPRSVLSAAEGDFSEGKPMTLPAGAVLETCAVREPML